MTKKLLIEKYNLEVELSDEETNLFNNSDSEFLTITDSTIKLRSSFLSNAKKVKDRWRYILQFDNSEQKYTLLDPSGAPSNTFNPESDRLTSEITNTNRNIVLVLESPHKDEYDQDFNPLSPAYGTTGRNIQKYLITHVIPILQSLGLQLNQSNYNLIISNPIQHQTSLAKIHQKRMCVSLRDKVWAALYPEYKDEFNSNILHYNPYVVINACTAGVKDILKINIHSSRKYETSHPSTWQRSLSPFKKT